MTAELVVGRRGAVAEIELKNPSHRNALTPAMLVDLAARVAELAAVGTVRALVLSGAGGIFSSGYSMATFPEPSELVDEDELHEACVALETAPFPVIARLEGYCIGAALELACACDIRVAAPGLRLGVPAAKIGLVYSLPGTRRLVRVAGLAAVQFLLYSGRLVTAESQPGSRFLSLVVERQQLTSETDRLAHEIAANAPLSLAGTRRALNVLDAATAIEPEDLRAVLDLRRAALASDDVAEGLAGFQARRPPSFGGT